MCGGRLAIDIDGLFEECLFPFPCFLFFVSRKETTKNSSFPPFLSLKEFLREERMECIVERGQRVLGFWWLWG